MVRALFPAFFVMILTVAPSLAQLTPDRTYYGVGRSIPVQVAVPADTKGEATIGLFAPGSAEPTETAPVVPGGANLAMLFPKFWEQKSAKVAYAQLIVGEKKIGPPVVLQPLLDGNPAFKDPNSGRPAFAPTGRSYNGLRAYVEKNVRIETSEGPMTFRMRPDQAPNTAWNFMGLAGGGFYTDIIFHRIMGSQAGRPPFMVQVGDPMGTGSGGPGFSIDLENSTLPHDFGVLSMARSNDPNSAGSQVFICLSREGTKFLDGGYCSFAELIDGQDALTKIAATPVVDNGSGEMSRPQSPPRIVSAKLVDALPFGEQPALPKAPAPAATPR